MSFHTYIKYIPVHTHSHQPPSFEHPLDDTLLASKLYVYMSLCTCIPYSGQAFIQKILAGRGKNQMSEKCGGKLYGHLGGLRKFCF